MPSAELVKAGLELGVSHLIVEAVYYYLDMYVDDTVKEARRLDNNGHKYLRMWNSRLDSMTTPIVVLTLVRIGGLAFKYKGVWMWYPDPDAVPTFPVQDGYVAKTKEKGAWKVDYWPGTVSHE